MGYPMFVNECKFLMPCDKLPGAFAAICDGEPHDGYAYHHNEKILDNSVDLVSAMKILRWEAKQNAEGDVIAMEFTGENYGDEDIIFSAIAPFVRNGSYIEMIGDDGDRWRWHFEDGRMTIKTPAITWE